MNKEGMIIVNKDGVDLGVYAIGSFEHTNGNEYLLYHLEEDDNIFASRIVETDTDLVLYDITDEELVVVQKVIDDILEGK